MLRLSLLLALLVAPGAMLSSARACAFPEDYVPPVRIGIVRGAQALHVGESVAMVSIWDGCNCVSDVSSPGDVRLRVSSSADGPFVDAPLELERQLLVWRPTESGVVFARFERDGHRPAQLVFLVTPRDVEREVELPERAERSRMFARLIIPGISSSEWRMPIVRLRRGRGRMARGHILPGHYALSTGRIRVRPLGCASGWAPRLRHHELGRTLGEFDVPALSVPPTQASTPMLESTP